MKFVREEAQSYFDGKLAAVSLVPDGEVPPFVMDWAAVEPGASTGEELGPMSKAFTVVRGTGCIIVQDERISLSPGIVVWIDPGVRHHLECDGEQVLELTVVKWHGHPA